MRPPELVANDATLSMAAAELLSFLLSLPCFNFACFIDGLTREQDERSHGGMAKCFNRGAETIFEAHFVFAVSLVELERLKYSVDLHTDRQKPMPILLTLRATGRQSS